MKANVKDDNAFIGGTIGIYLAVASALLLIVYFMNEAGVFDTLNTGIGDFIDIFTSGTSLGSWLGGIIVGILSAMWNFGTDIGTGIFT